MMRWPTLVLVVVCLVVVAVAIGLPMVVGLRPLIGPRARRLTDSKLQSSPNGQNRDGIWLDERPCTLRDSVIRRSRRRR